MININHNNHQIIPRKLLKQGLSLIQLTNVLGNVDLVERFGVDELFVK